MDSSDKVLKLIDQGATEALQLKAYSAASMRRLRAPGHGCHSDERHKQPVALPLHHQDAPEGIAEDIGLAVCAAAAVLRTI